MQLDLVVRHGNEGLKSRVFSSGTVDQIYLAFRLAMVRLLSENSAPYMTSTQYDDERTKIPYPFGKEAQNRQVILFTCHRELEILQRLGKYRVIRIGTESI